MAPTADVVDADQKDPIDADNEDHFEIIERLVLEIKDLRGKPRITKKNSIVIRKKLIEMKKHISPARAAIHEIANMDPPKLVRQ